ncbi:MAG: hypothetical protein AAFW89_00495 [Bacteroidota bacterium]
MLSTLHPELVKETKRKGAAGITFAPATYEFKELAAWRELIRGFTIDIPGMAFLDIDESADRIVLSTENVEEATPFIHAKLNSFEIPLEAVIIEFAEQMSMGHSRSFTNCDGPDAVFETFDDECYPVGGGGNGSGGGGGSSGGGHIPEGETGNGGNTNYTLQSPQSTFVGGVRVKNDKGSACTLGLNVLFGVYNSRKGFVTASDCTEEFADLDGGDFWQGQTELGFEVVDRKSFTKYTGDSYCTDGYQCKYSNVALVEYFPTPSFSQSAPVGVIAQPYIINSIELLDTDDLYGYYVTDNASWPYRNMNIHKVGSTTGLTTGKITKSCADAYVTKDEVNYMFICVSTTDYSSSNGDEGAPVITNSYSSGHYSIYDFEVMLVGFHIGRFSTTGGNVSSVLSGARYTVGSVHTGCAYANGWLNSELCDEGIDIGPFETRFHSYRQQ